MGEGLPASTTNHHHYYYYSYYYYYHHHHCFRPPPPRHILLHPQTALMHLVEKTSLPIPPIPAQTQHPCFPSYHLSHPIPLTHPTPTCPPPLPHQWVFWVFWHNTLDNTHTSSSSSSLPLCPPPIATPRPYLPAPLAASVGVLAELDQLDNTYIIFASDNGFHVRSHNLHPGWVGGGAWARG